jgi:hypothetical protein
VLKQEDLLADVCFSFDYCFFFILIFDSCLFFRNSAEMSLFQKRSTVNKKEVDKEKRVMMMNDESTLKKKLYSNLCRLMCRYRGEAREI